MLDTNIFDRLYEDDELVSNLFDRADLFVTNIQIYEVRRRDAF